MADENCENASFELFSLMVQEKLSTIVKSISEADVAEIALKNSASKVYDYYVKRTTEEYKKQWELMITTYDIKSKYEILQKCIEKYKSPNPKWRPPIGNPKLQFQDLYLQAMETRTKLLENELMKLKTEANEAKKQLQLERETFIKESELKLKNWLQKYETNITDVTNETKVIKILH